MPEVSVVVPIYNVEAYLSKCIDSLLAQSYTDFECILVNDGSKDQSLSIAQEYQKKDARIRLINQENGGLSAARNAGLKIATGKYIAFVDSDDFVEPDYLQKSIEQAEKHNADMVIFDIYQYYQQTGTKEVIHCPFEEGKPVNIQNTPTLLTSIPNAAWNKVYRRSLFTDNDIEYPKGKLYEDLGTTYRLLARAKTVVFVNTPLYNYLKDRPGNITGSFNTRAYDILDMVQMNIEDYQKLGIFETYYEELKYLSCINVMECLKKTRDCNDTKLVESYIDTCFKTMKHYFPDFPKGKYNVKREKYDDIYTSPTKLKWYLRYRKMKKR